MNRDTISIVFILLVLCVLCVSNASCAGDDSESRPSAEEQETEKGEIVRQWELAQESSPLIAKMLLQSVTLLTMAEERGLSLSLLSSVGKCFSGSLDGGKVDRSCKAPMDLVNLGCPCLDPAKDCDPNWHVSTFWKCVGDAIRCRIENSTLCQ